MKPVIAHAADSADSAAALASRLQAYHKQKPEELILVNEQSSRRFFKRLGEGSRIFHLISADLLLSSSFMDDLLTNLEDEGSGPYSDHVVPVIVPASFQQTEIEWNRQILARYWDSQASALKLELGSVSSPDEQVRIDAAERVAFISERIGEFYELVQRHLRLQRVDSLLELPDSDLQTLSDAVPMQEPRWGGTRNGSSERLAKIYRSIPNPLPETPEFPPFSPRFPATPTATIKLTGPRQREIVVKDESANWTGSHKDRMAWELVQVYKRMLRDRLESDEIDPELPAMSMISSGSAAFATQTLLRLFGLPPLRVLHDSHLDQRIIERLSDIGCVLFPCDLSEGLLADEDVLTRTENPDGLDVTSRDVADAGEFKYYDWLSFEILNLKPRWIFVPVGTGDLFINIARIIERSLNNRDVRLDVGRNEIRGLQLVGATTNNASSSMDKLYAPFRPDFERRREFVEKRKEIGVFGHSSGIYEVEDDEVAEAARIAETFEIATEPSGIAGLALCRKMLDGIPEDDKIVVVNTGRLVLESQGSVEADESASRQPRPLRLARLKDRLGWS